MADPFPEGTWLTHRELVDGKLWLSYPVRVVADDGAELVVYLAQGTRMTFAPEPGAWGPHPWQVLGERWLSRGVLRIHPVGADHSVEARWNEQGDLICWYVNFQEPLRRGADGYDTLDQELDLVVAPDLSSVRLKDAEHFIERVGRGHLPAASATRVLEAAAELIELLGQRVSWWDLNWAKWSPPADWQPGND